MHIKLKQHTSTWKCQTGPSRTLLELHGLIRQILHTPTQHNIELQKRRLQKLIQLHLIACLAKHHFRAEYKRKLWGFQKICDHSTATFILKKRKKTNDIQKPLDYSRTVLTDGIGPYVLHTAREAFAPVLALLFNESLELGTDSSWWYEANVTPIYKSKGSRLDPSNYKSHLSPAKLWKNLSGTRSVN